MNYDLFSEEFPSVNSDKEFDKLCADFSKYDPGYLCQATYSLRKHTKDWMEKLWLQYKPYADIQFRTDFRHQFTQRAWELYLGATLLNRGFDLGKHRNSGPDFDLRNATGKRIAWIEAVTATQGNGADRVPDIAYGAVSSVPVEKMVLRIANSLYVKYKKYCSDRESGLVSENDPYVIAIDRSELGHGDALLPLILKALFGIGDLALRMRVGGESVEEPERFWTSLPSLEKTNGQIIPMLFFENPEHSGISAVIYTKDHVINSPRNSNEMGENFVVVHNPLAKNPLLRGIFPFGEEYIAEDGFIKKIRESKNYERPDPFAYLGE